MDDERPEGLFVFRFADRRYDCLQVLAAAEFRGELEPVRQSLAQGHRRTSRADELGLEIPEEALSAAADSFRYQRNLIRAEETERWLDQRRLAIDDLDDFLTREYWKTAPEARLDCADPPADALEPEEALSLLAIEALLSGCIDGMALRLAWRIAALDASGERAPSVDEIEAERKRFLERTAAGPQPRDAEVAPLACEPDWLEELLRMEAAFRRRCQALLTREARERVLRAKRLDLVRLDYEVLELDSLDAAREAFLCAVEDGVSLGELGATQRYPYARTQVLAGGLAEEERRKLLSARPGELLPPGSGRRLCRVLDKIEPCVDDDETRERLDDWLVRAHFDDLTRGRFQLSLEGDGAA